MAFNSLAKDPMGIIVVKQELYFSGDLQLTRILGLYNDDRSFSHYACVTVMALLRIIAYPKKEKKHNLCTTGVSTLFIYLLSSSVEKTGSSIPSEKVQLELIVSWKGTIQEDFTSACNNTK